jgi:ABC-2 type transport system permease protein
MTSAQMIYLVARREVVERLRTRLFKVSTLLTLAFIAAAIVLPKVLDRPTTWNIGVTDIRASRVAETAKQLLLTSEPDAKVTIVELSEAQARKQVSVGDLDVVLSAVDSKAPTAIVRRQLSDFKRSLLAGAIQQRRIIDQAASLGITEQQAFSLIAPGELELAILDPPDPDRDSDRSLALGGAILLFIMVMQFGMAIASGVVEEKSSRVLELLLGRMTTRTLLTGKLLGIGSLGLGQMLLFTVFGVGLSGAVGSVTLRASSIALVALTMLWFVLGYLVFAGLYLIAGSLAGRQEDLQSTTGIPIVISMASYFTAIAALPSPDAAWVPLAAVAPFTAPLLQPSRFADGSLSFLEGLFGVGIAVLTIRLLIGVAAKVYNRTVLMRTQTSMWRLFRSRKSHQQLPQAEA